MLGLASTFPMLITIQHLEGLIPTLVKRYGYESIFFLMMLEGATLPVPSEVVLPLAGLLAAKGLLNFYIAFLAGVAGSMVGSMIDYALGYYIGKEIIYKHLSFFHIKKKSLDDFDVWFAKNGKVAVFLTRLIPIVRTIINFPAGFAKMRLRDFLAYSLGGIVLWDLILMVYGYYFLSAKSAIVVLAGAGLLAIAVYIVYTVAIRRVRRR